MIFLAAESSNGWELVAVDAARTHHYTGHSGWAGTSLSGSQLTDTINNSYSYTSAYRLFFKKPT
jgi:hypothetical protein